MKLQFDTNQEYQKKAVISEATLLDQVKKTQLEYRVVAANKSGEGQTSNTVMVVL